MPENAPLIIIIIFRKHDMWNDFFFFEGRERLQQSGEWQMEKNEEENEDANWEKDILWDFHSVIALNIIVNKRTNKNIYKFNIYSPDMLWLQLQFFKWRSDHSFDFRLNRLFFLQHLPMHMLSIGELNKLKQTKVEVMTPQKKNKWIA